MSKNFNSISKYMKMINKISLFTLGNIFSFFNDKLIKICNDGFNILQYIKHDEIIKYVDLKIKVILLLIQMI